MIENELEMEKRKLAEAKNDQEKFEFFVNKYAQRIYEYFYYRTHSEADSDALTWKTFTTAYVELTEFEWREVLVGAWLYSIANNHFRSFYKDIQRRREVELGSHGESNILEMNALDLMVVDEDKRFITRLIGTLDASSQEIFKLRFLDGLSIMEISSIMDMSDGTVKSRLSRDTRKLQRRYKQERFVYKNTTNDILEKEASEGGVGKERRPIGRTNG